MLALNEYIMTEITNTPVKIHKMQNLFEVSLIKESLDLRRTDCTLVRPD